MASESLVEDHADSAGAVASAEGTVGDAAVAAAAVSDSGIAPGGSQVPDHSFC